MFEALHLIPRAFAQVTLELPAISGAPEPSSPAAFVTYLFVFALGTVGLATLIAFLMGAFRYFFSAADPAAVNDAKDRMLHAFIGFFVVIAATITLYTINPSLLRFRNPALPSLLLPTPSTTAGECRITAAQWAGTGSPGAEISLIATTADCNDGIVVTFRIFDPSGSPTGIILSGTIARGQASATWTIPSSATNMAYTFEAIIGAAKAGSEALGGGSGDVFLTEECKNLESGSNPPTTCFAPCHNTVNLSVTNPATGQPYTYTCEDIINQASTKYSVSRALMVAIMTKECPTGNPYCQSAMGSCGLMQVNPSFTGTTQGEAVACQPLLGAEATDPAKACEIMKANPDIAVNVGACLLSIYARDATRKKTANNYPGNEIQYIAAAYNGGPGANEPSCNCRNKNDTLPATCPANSVACVNCAYAVPKWVCLYDNPPLGRLPCPANTGFAETRDYAASVGNFYAHYASCAEWQ